MLVTTWESEVSSVQGEPKRNSNLISDILPTWFSPGALYELSLRYIRTETFLHCKLYQVTLRSFMGSTSDLAKFSSVRILQ